MSDRHDDEGRHRPPHEDAALAARLRTLEAKLESRRATEEAAGRPAARFAGRGLAQAFRMASEFVAGILVGAGLGWLFDWWLGTSPWGLMVFLLLGFAAGVLNLLRAVGAVPERGLAPPEVRERRDDERDE